MNKKGTTDRKPDEAVRVVIPLNNDDIQKANLSQENKSENNVKNKSDRENKDGINIEKSISMILLIYNKILFNFQNFRRREFYQN